MRESDAFNFYATHSVQKLLFVLHIEVPLIDSGDQNKRDKQIKTFRQAVSLAGKLFQLSNFYWQLVTKLW